MSTPEPADAIMVSAISSCCRQSQRKEPNTSPVKHWEWIRTSGTAERTSPMTRATAVSSFRRLPSPNSPSKPRIRNAPQRVGKSASATLRTGLEKITTLLYGERKVECDVGDGRQMGSDDLPEPGPMIYADQCQAATRRSPSAMLHFGVPRR